MLVGGEEPDEVNIISGNNGHGVHVENVEDNNFTLAVLNNKIGVAVSASQVITNAYNGVLAIGTDQVLVQGNMLSGNQEAGISIQGMSRTSALICDNKIGVDLTGNTVLGNGGSGVYAQDAQLIIGDAGTCSGNVISGNNHSGIHFVRVNQSSVAYNKLGVNTTGTVAASNLYHGIILEDSHNNVITNNVISGNGHDGAVLGSLSSNNQIHSNKIGTDITGSFAIGNALRGVAGWGASHNNTVFNNLISGNSVGIVFHDPGTDGSHIYGNLIGTNSVGDAPIANTESGIIIDQGANHLIGGDTVVQRNIISGNGGFGVVLSGPSATGNLVQGNYIGLDFSATQAVGNGLAGIGLFSGTNSNQIGGLNANERNVISGNGYQGINISGHSNYVVGNYVGSDVTGSVLIGNGEDGILAYGDISAAPGQNAIIANLVVGSGYSGIAMSSSGNVVQGNYVGVDVTGSFALPNNDNGIYIAGNGNVIGGSAPEQRNVISGNNRTGIVIGPRWPDGAISENNVVQGNYVGTNAQGVYPISNREQGIFVSGINNQIGGNISNQGNLVSGNRQSGIIIGGGTNNRVQGNKVGVDVTGVYPIPNQSIGVSLWEGVSNNLVGGDSPELGNIIAFNNDVGVFVDRTNINNTIAHNSIYRNQNVALRITVNTTLYANNVYDNGVNRIEMPAAALLPGVEQTWEPQGKTSIYYVHYNCETCELEIPNTSTLSLGSGAQLRMDYNRSIVVHGALNLLGSPDGSAVVMGPRHTMWSGDWQGIFFKPGSSGYLNYADVSYARHGLHNEGTLVVQNSVISANFLTGIKNLSGGQLTLHNNSFGFNRQYDIDNQTASVVNAQGSWWGSTSGPSLAKINGPVNTSNWRATENENNGNWYQADLLADGIHQFTISARDDFDWYRIPIVHSNQTVSLTLRNLPADYDVFLFSHLEFNPTDDPEEAARLMSLPRIMHIGELNATGGLESIPRIMHIAQVFASTDHLIDTGQLVSASTNSGREAENISFFVGNQVGWYYLLVAGSNGANRPGASYTLEVRTLSSTTGSENATVPTFPPLDETFDNETLFITNWTAFTERYGQTQTQAVSQKIDELAAHPDVNGYVINLADIDLVHQQYISWTAQITNVQWANWTAATVKSYLSAIHTSYPNLKYIVIVGNDEIVPHWRVLDEAPIANERGYESFTLGDSAVGAALSQGYYFSDDFYGDFYPLSWRGRQIYFPQYAIGRLVEAPDDIIAVVDAFLASSTTTVHASVVTGYDFLIDQAHAIEYMLRATDVSSLIDNQWSARDLREVWFSSPNQFVSLNAHFSHWDAVPANLDPDNHFMPVDILSGLWGSEGSLVYSVGCHSGLCMPDNQSLVNYSLDFCQAFASKGLTYIANTGYGYGDTETIGYSERLSVLFLDSLKQGLAVGDALSAAKLNYYHRAAANSFSPYDEKVLSQTTLYGLPMQRFEIPQPPDAAAQRLQTEDQCSVVEGNSFWGLETREVNCNLSMTLNQTSRGDFYSVGDETQVTMGYPVLPRTNVSVSVPNLIAKGAIFEGGEYTTLYNFDPVITQVITESTTYLDEPPLTIQAWLPSTWDVINSVRTAQGLSQNLVIIPAQYYATEPTEGTKRIFNAMNYTVYYSDRRDNAPPTIWESRGRELEGAVEFRVETTDFSGIARVVIAYTYDNGQWFTLDLVQTSSVSDVWHGVLMTDDADLTFFVQALDRAGNVAVDDNKGTYYSAEVIHEIFLPIVMSQSSNRDIEQVLIRSGQDVDLLSEYGSKCSGVQSQIVFVPVPHSLKTVYEYCNDVQEVIDWRFSISSYLALASRLFGNVIQPGAISVDRLE